MQWSIVEIVTAESFTVDRYIVGVQIAVGRWSQIKFNKNKIQMTNTSLKLLDVD